MSVMPSGVMAIVLLECFREVEFGESDVQQAWEQKRDEYKDKQCPGLHVQFLTDLDGQSNSSNIPRTFSFLHFPLKELNHFVQRTKIPFLAALDMFNLYLPISLWKLVICLAP